LLLSNDDVVCAQARELPIRTEHDKLLRVAR
jgi:hypothetical protein